MNAEKMMIPENKEKFIQLIKDKSLYCGSSMICYPKRNSKTIRGEIENGIKNAVDIEKDFRLSLSRRKEVAEE